MPELSHAIAEYWVSALHLLDAAVAMRTSNRPRVSSTSQLVKVNVSYLLCSTSTVMSCICFGIAQNVHSDLIDCC